VTELSSEFRWGSVIILSRIYVLVKSLCYQIIDSPVVRCVEAVYDNG